MVSNRKQKVYSPRPADKAEAESKEKHDVWDRMPELNTYCITSPYVHSRVDSNTFTKGIGQSYARVDLNPMSESPFVPQSGT